MNLSNFNEDFFSNVREMCVWEKLSEDGNFWSEALIDCYQDKINWKSLSGNNNVQWTASMLEKYKRRLDWKALSERRGSNGAFSSEILKRFSSKWDWAALSSNTNVGWTMEKVEEVKDFIDWGKIIDCWQSDLYTLEFFEKYKDYFPVSSLQQSRLWSSILEIYKNKMIEQILSK